MNVQEDINHIVDFILLNDLLQLTVLPANLNHVFGVEPHLFKVNKDAPSPILYAVVLFDLNPDESAWLEERNNVLRKRHYLIDLSSNLVSLLLKLLLLAKQLFVR